MLLAWMPRLGKFRATKDGKDYYKHNRQQFIVNVPVIAYTPGNDDEYVMCTVGHGVGGNPVTMMIPFNDENTMMPDLEQNLEDVKRVLLQHMEALLRSKQTIPTENGPKYVVHMESDLMWVWDEEALMTFDEKIVRHIYANDTIDFETLMDRPLRGLPLVDEHMYRSMGLCPLATTEITSPGGCVVAQIVQTVTTEKKVGERNTVGGKRIDNRKVVQVPH